MNAIVRKFSYQNNNQSRWLNLTVKEKEKLWKNRQRKINIGLLIGITSFTFWIYYYCVSVVKQDTFSDVDQYGNVSTKIKEY
jgi:hypothetical protein